MLRVVYSNNWPFLLQFCSLPDKFSVGLLHNFALRVEAQPPSNCVLDLELQPCSAFFIETVFVLNFILVRFRIERPAVDGQEVGQLDEVELFAEICRDLRNFNINPSFRNLKKESKGFYIRYLIE